MRTFMRFVFLALITVVISAAALAQYSQPVRDVENPSQSPFWSIGQGQSAEPLVNFFVIMNPKVPAGKRLTVEFVSIKCTAPETDSISEVRVSVFKRPGTTFEVPIAMQRQGTDAGLRATWIASQPVKLYLDSLSWDPSIYVNVFHKEWAAPSGSAVCAVFVSGSLVSAP